MHAAVVLVNVAGVETFDLNGKLHTSGIRKRPQDGPVRVTEAGLDGDGVGNLEHHGGPNRALHVFAAEHYDAFAAELSAIAPRPWVGENLTVRGYTDAIARLGDELRIGTARVRVTMPTERCSYPGRVSGIPKLRKRMVDTLRTGFYLRVIEPGVVRRGDPIEIVEAGDPAWTIERLSGVMYRHVEDAELVREIEALDALAPEWKRSVRKLHTRKSSSAR